MSKRESVTEVSLPDRRIKDDAWRFSLLVFDDQSYQQVVTRKGLSAEAIATTTVVSCTIRASEGAEGDLERGFGRQCFLKICDSCSLVWDAATFWISPIADGRS
jgi:hypothetical protein